MFDSREYEFSDVTLILGGKDIIGIQSVTYTETVTRTPLYGKGRYPLAMQTGNVTISGSFKVTQSELEKLLDAGRGSLLNLKLNAEVNYGNPSAGQKMITDRIEGIYFSTTTKSIKSGDTAMIVELPFSAMRINFHVR